MRPSSMPDGADPKPLLGQGKGLRHGRRQNVHGDAVALQRFAGQDFDIEVLGDVIERLAAVQGRDQVLGIFRDLGPHLVAPPVLGDLVLDLIERLELSGHHTQHLVPDDAFILGVDRIVLDASVGGENGIQHIFLRRQRDGRAVGLPAFAVDLVDQSDRSSLSLPATSESVGARGELVLDLVMQIEDRARGAVLQESSFRDRPWPLRRSALLPGSISVTRSSTTLPSLPVTGSLTLFTSSAKAASAMVGSANSAAGHRAEIDVSLAQALLLGDRREVGAGLNLLIGGVGSGESGKGICCTCRFSGVPSCILALPRKQP